MLILYVVSDDYLETIFNLDKKDNTLSVKSALDRENITTYEVVVIATNQCIDKPKEAVSEESQLLVNITVRNLNYSIKKYLSACNNARINRSLM